MTLQIVPIDQNVDERGQFGRLARPLDPLLAGRRAPADPPGPPPMAAASGPVAHVSNRPEGVGLEQPFKRIFPSFRKSHRHGKEKRHIEIMPRSIRSCRHSISAGLYLQDPSPRSVSARMSLGGRGTTPAAATRPAGARARPAQPRRLTTPPCHAIDGAGVARHGKSCRRSTGLGPQAVRSVCGESKSHRAPIQPLRARAAVRRAPC